MLFGCGDAELGQLLSVVTTRVERFVRHKQQSTPSVS